MPSWLLPERTYAIDQATLSTRSWIVRLDRKDVGSRVRVTAPPSGSVVSFSAPSGELLPFRLVSTETGRAVYESDPIGVGTIYVKITGSSAAPSVEIVSGEVQASAPATSA